MTAGMARVTMDMKGTLLISTENVPVGSKANPCKQESVCSYWLWRFPSLNQRNYLPKVESKYFFSSVYAINNSIILIIA
jgi:hypothetical protein